LLATLIAAAPAMADKTESLFAIEGGYSDLSADVSQSAYSVQNAGMGHVGLKLGAQGENYRVFLSGRYYAAEKSNTLATAGAEIQYKFNFSNPVDFFIGANGGVAFIKIGQSDDGALASVSTNAPYFGGDAGFNYHASELIDLELGVKYMNIDDTVTQGATTYEFNNMTTAYASIIIKYQLD
jgi:hypothetical protein